MSRLDIAAANEPDELGRDEARGTAGRRSMTLDAATSLGTMNRRDRLGNLVAFAAAAVAWLVVGIVVTTRDPIREPDAGLLGAGAIGIAFGLTAIPLFWLAAYRAASTGRVSRLVGAGRSPRGVGCDRRGAVRRAPDPGSLSAAHRAVRAHDGRDRRGDPVGGALTWRSTSNPGWTLKRHRQNRSRT